MVEQSETNNQTSEAPSDKTEEKEKASVQDDLDTLFSEFENKDQDKGQDDKEKLELSDDDVRFLRQEQIQKENDRIKSDISEAVKVARGDSDLPEEANTLIEGFLHQAVANDPKMNAAWQGRAKNPEAWNKILGKQSEKFASLIEKIVESKSVSNSALEAAVHSSKSSTPPNDNLPGLGKLASMSDTEFAKLKSG